MTRLIRTTILMVNVLLAAVMIAGQVEGQVLAERTFEAPSTAEVVLDLTASSPGAAWIAPGREAAAPGRPLQRLAPDCGGDSGAVPEPATAAAPASIRVSALHLQV